MDELMGIGRDARIREKVENDLNTLIYREPDKSFKKDHHMVFTRANTQNGSRRSSL